MENLINLLGDENVDVAAPDGMRGNRYNKLDKDAVKKKLETKKQFEDIQIELADKSFEERKEWILSQKKVADEMYYQKNFAEALQVYLRALMGLNYSGLSGEQKNDLDFNIKFKVLTNMALTAHYLEKYAQSNSFTDQALAIQETAKVHYIYAMNQHKLQNYDRALGYIKKATAMIAQSDPSYASYAALYSKIHADLIDYREKQKRMYGKMFGESERPKSQEHGAKEMAQADQIWMRQKGICQRICNRIRSIVFWKKDKVKTL